MRGVYEFQCKNGHINDRYFDHTIKEIQCPECNEMAYKIISAPRCLRMDGKPIDIMSDAWAKRREDNARRIAERDGP